MTDSDPSDPEVDMLWFHGSPLRLTVLLSGSTITNDRDVARIFSHKPSLVSRDDAGRTGHNGAEPGFLYEVLEVEPDDVYPHPTTTMDPGIEWLTRRDLRLSLIGETSPRDDEFLSADDLEELRQRLNGRDR